MNEITASRTLVKSPPELWAECSDAESLARHLGEFGEIRITKLEPETAVVWEGEEFSGTVRLEPSGWGTKVHITARGEATETLPVCETAPAPAAPAPEPEAAPTPAADRGGLLARLFGRFLRPAAPVAPPTAPEAETGVAAASAASSSAESAAGMPPSEPEQHLHTALESLGQAHRRPFSRG